MKNPIYVGTLTPMPSLICKKLHYKGKLQPTESEGLTLLGGSDHIHFGYDVDKGEIKVILNPFDLKSSVRELGIWMAEHQIPFQVGTRATFFIDASMIRLSDIPELKRCHFKKREIDDNNNSIDHIWEFLPSL